MKTDVWLLVFGLMFVYSGLYLSVVMVFPMGMIIPPFVSWLGGSLLGFYVYIKTLEWWLQNDN